MTTPKPGHSPALPDEDLTDLLNEIRLLLPGTLLLVAFLIAVPSTRAIPVSVGSTMISPRSLHAAYRRRNWRCAGLLTSQASQQLFPAPGPRSRLVTMPRWLSWAGLTRRFEQGLPSFMIAVFDHLCTPAGSVHTYPNQDWLLLRAQLLRRTWPYVMRG